MAVVATGGLSMFGSVTTPSETYPFAEYITFLQPSKFISISGTLLEVIWLTCTSWWSQLDAESFSSSFFGGRFNGFTMTWPYCI